MPDPITEELFRNAIAAVGDEMVLTIYRTAYSGVLKNIMDYSAALCDAEGRLVAQGLSLPGHLCSIPVSLQAVLRQFGDDVAEGDVFINNDPYDGGMHLPDIFIFKPIFSDGRVLAYAATICHHTDVGGRVPGSNASDSTEIYAEGLRIPPLKLYDAGRPNTTLFRMIERNVRMPNRVFGDIRSQLAACEIAARGMADLVARHGADDVRNLMVATMDYSERLTRHCLRELPDGEATFTDWIDDDQIDMGRPIPLVCTIRKRGDTMEVDWTGSSPQVKGAINNTWSYTAAMSFTAVKSVLSINMPNNDGVFRPIKVIAPSGTITNGKLPAACAARGLTGFRGVDCAFGALAKLYPHLVFAASDGGNTGLTIGGYDKELNPFIYVDFISGAWGARPWADGLDGNTCMFANMASFSVEVIEAENPLEVLDYEFVPDTGGAGKFRGGMSQRKTWRMLADEGILQVRADRQTHRPYGLQGGGPGAFGVNMLDPGQPTEEKLHAKLTMTLRKGQVFRHELPGAGAWGDALSRDLTAVGQDLRDGLVSIDGAERDYGVVAAGDPPVIDAAATEALRAELRASRPKLPEVAWEPAYLSADFQPGRTSPDACRTGREGIRPMTLRIGIDIGGTFTDLVAVTADGRVSTHKTASTPHDYSEGIIDGLRALLAREPEPVSDVLHATTVGSNTVLEAKGARTALITTRGFRDILEIRDLRMPVLYDMRWTKPRALVERRLRLEVTEKMRPDGSVSVALDPVSVDKAIAMLRAEGVESVAICLLHSYANPAHERAVADAVRLALPGIAISLSSEILPEIKEYPRTSTTVINAYVQPIVRAYVTSLDARLRALGITAPLQLMQSNGGLASADFVAEQPAHIIESGPAAGVVGGAALARRLDEPRLITFDMGGTTAKAGLVENGEVLRSEAIEVGGGVMAGSRLLVGAGYMLKLPAIDLAEVGAGGGSICRLDAGGAPKVGPDSAGADPGPACYGRGGTAPTITDCNLVLGYLDPGGLVGGALKLDGSAAREAVARDLAGPMGCPVEEAAFGMLRLAAATMMRAIRAISVERGRDPRQFTLLAFGGNGPLFAAGIAAELGIARVLIPPLPGVFSAFGLLVADTEHHASQSLRLRLDQPDQGRIDATLSTLRTTGDAVLARDGFPSAQRAFRRSAHARYVGQSSEIEVHLPDGADTLSPATLAELFGQEHERTYGFRAPPDEPVELMGLSVIARGLPLRPRLPERIRPMRAAVPASRRVWFPATGWTDIPVLDRASLAAIPRAGPLIVQEYDATCLVPAGMTAALDGFGNIRLARA